MYNIDNDEDSMSLSMFIDKYKSSYDEYDKIDKKDYALLMHEMYNLVFENFRNYFDEFINEIAIISICNETQKCYTKEELYRILEFYSGKQARVGIYAIHCIEITKVYKQGEEDLKNIILDGINSLYKANIKIQVDDNDTSKELLNKVLYLKLHDYIKYKGE
jgi:hypothetical protein